MPFFDWKLLANSERLEYDVIEQESQGKNEEEKISTIPSLILRLLLLLRRRRLLLLEKMLWWKKHETNNRTHTFSEYFILGKWAAAFVWLKFSFFTRYTRRLRNVLKPILLVNWVYQFRLKISFSLAIEIEPVPNHALWCLSIEWILESNSKQASQDRSDGYKISAISCGANFSSFLVQSPKGTFTVSVMSPIMACDHFYQSILWEGVNCQLSFTDCRQINDFVTR